MARPNLRGQTCEDNLRGQAKHGPTVFGLCVTTCPGISKIRRLIRMNLQGQAKHGPTELARRTGKAWPDRTCEDRQSMARPYLVYA